MYSDGREVYVKSLGVLATIIQANWQVVGKRRRASYLVDLGGGHDYLTGSDDLRAADACCDSCSRWMPHGSFNGGTTGPDGEYPAAMRFCFLCTRDAERDNERARDAYYAERL